MMMIITEKDATYWMNMAVPYRDAKRESCVCTYHLQWHGKTGTSGSRISLFLTFMHFII